MNYQEITMWLTVANSLMIAVGGFAITRIIGKNKREDNKNKDLLDLLPDETRRGIATIISKAKQEDKSDRQRPNKDSSGDGG